MRVKHSSHEIKRQTKSYIAYRLALTEFLKSQIFRNLLLMYERKLLQSRRSNHGIYEKETGIRMASTTSIPAPSRPVLAHFNTATLYGSLPKDQSDLNKHVHTHTQ